jgi:hypothetical protein
LEELVSGLLRPKLFPFGKLSKAKPAAQYDTGLFQLFSTGGKFTAGVVELPPVSTTPAEVVPNFSRCR